MACQAGNKRLPEQIMIQFTDVDTLNQALICYGWIDDNSGDKYNAKIRKLNQNIHCDGGWDYLSMSKYLPVLLIFSYALT